MCAGWGWEKVMVRRDKAHKRGEDKTMRDEDDDEDEDGLDVPVHRL
jgi:hypothetical protein